MESVRGLQADMKKEIDGLKAGGAGKGGGGKGSGKAQRRAEQRSRSISFKGFPKDTPATSIIETMKSFITSERMHDIEE
eukprot:3739898-Karenia_brevis.AAC.1